MATGAWTCACGRRVPGHIAVCRCGKPRGGSEPSARQPPVAQQPPVAKQPPVAPRPPVAKPPVAKQPPVLKPLVAKPPPVAKQPPAAPQPPRHSVRPSWQRKALVALALVGLYFAWPLGIKYNDSRKARATAVQALSKVADAKLARDAVGQHHGACFDEFYKIGWGPRQASSFQSDKYSRCVLRKASGYIEEQALAARLAAARGPQAAPSQPAAAAAAVVPAPAPIAAPTVAPTAAPTAAPTEQPGWGKVTLGDVKVAEFKREPQLTLRLDFVALGNGLTQDAFCSISVACEGRPAPAAPVVVGCALRVEGVKGVGTLQHVEAGPAPPGGACTLELQLSDGRQARTNAVKVALR